jgi:hypothetical protein
LGNEASWHLNDFYNLEFMGALEILACPIIDGLAKSKKSLSFRATARKLS